jgi:hypothetical protein
VGVVGTGPRVAIGGQVEGSGGRHWVDKAGARGHGTYSELSLFAVKVCKVDLDTISVAQDAGSVV